MLVTACPAFVTKFAEKANLCAKRVCGGRITPGLRSVNLPHPGLFLFDPFRVMSHLAGVPLLKPTQTGYAVCLYNGCPDRWYYCWYSKSPASHCTTVKPLLIPLILRM